MDGPQHSISPHDLYTRLGTATPPILIDVRRAADFAAADSLVMSASHRLPEHAAPSPASNSSTEEGATHSTPSYGSSASRTRDAVIWRGWAGAPTLRGMISCRNAGGCLGAHLGCPPIFPTTMRC